MYINLIRYIAIGSYIWQKTSQCRHFEVKVKQTSVFLDFSKLANTFGNVLTIPCTKMSEYVRFAEEFTFCIMNSPGFGML